MSLKEDIVKKILEHYIESRDYNGILAAELAKINELEHSDFLNVLKDLI